MRRVRRYLAARRNASVGALAIALMALIIFTDYTGALRDFFSSGSPSVSALFANAKTLNVGDPVYVHGVVAGQVTALQSEPGARTTLVQMSVSSSAGAFYRNATANVHWRTILGGAFYVAVDPGSPSSGALGGAPIPASQTSSQVELDDISSVVSGEAKSGLTTTIGQLGVALSNAHALGALSAELARIAPSVSAGVGALRGQQLDSDLRNLVSATGSTMSALDAPNGQLRTLISGAASTLDTTAGRSGDLSYTIAHSPAVMDLTNSTLSKLDTTLGLVNPLVAKLQTPATELNPALATLHPVAVSAAALLDRARPLLRDLRPAVRSLSSASSQALPLLDQVSPSLARLANSILPYMSAKDPITQHSAAEMVGSGAGGLGLVAAQLDPNGHYLRFPATAGSSSLYLPCQTYIANPDAAQLLACQTLQTQLQEYLGYNPLAPAPGTSTAKRATR